MLSLRCVSGDSDVIISDKRLRELAPVAKSATERAVASQLESARTELRGSFHSFHALAATSGHCGASYDRRCWGCASLRNEDVLALLGEKI